MDYIRGNFEAAFAKALAVNEEITIDTLSRYRSLIRAQAGTLTKTEQFLKLANLTYSKNGYKTELESTGIIYAFPNPVTTIKNWKQYTDPNIDYRTKGNMIEAAIVDYMNRKPPASANHIDAKGVDINTYGKSGGVVGKVEVKSSERATIQTQLQTSHYQDDSLKFYFFVTNTSKKDIDVTVVSSQILHRLSLLDFYMADLEDGKTIQDLIGDKIKEGLSRIDFEHQIVTALLTGSAPEGVEKSFMLTDNLKVRFLMFIEPQSKVLK